MKQKIEVMLGKYKNVRLFDEIYQLSSYLSSFDYLFMPSNFEGLALMPIEASFNKLPCIINSCPGLEETLPPDWPLKVKDNTVENYLKIFRDKIFEVDREKLIQEAYEYVEKRFSLEKMQSEYEAIYRKKIN